MVPLSTLHKTLKGQRVVDVEDLYNICFGLGIDPTTIIEAATAVVRADPTFGMQPPPPEESLLLLDDDDDDDVGPGAEDDDLREELPVLEETRDGYDVAARKGVDEGIEQHDDDEEATR
ncbi:MAG: hypothetical protein JWP66_1965 [Naasia sp.]|nr:hypothetical protein [Naasia sp.]